MTKEKLQLITATVEGYEVKNLRWLAQDNIIVGFVKCPLLGKADFRDGFISCQWTKHGYPLRINKGRKELNLVIPK